MSIEQGPSPETMGIQTEDTESENGHQEAERVVDSFTTARGSEYRYLPDGTTQRFKKAENRLYEPQSAIVFLPDFETLKKAAPPSFDIESVLGDNEIQAEQTLLERVQRKGSRNYIVNAKGEKLETNQAIHDEQGPIFLTFGTDKGVEFHLPVSKDPKVGYYSFDTRKYYDEKEGHQMRERHLGNKITEIRYK